MDVSARDGGMERRSLLAGAIGAVGSMAGSTALIPEALAQTGSSIPAGPPVLQLLASGEARLPPGEWKQWEKVWGGRNVPLLERNGQWLWGAWRPLSGQIDTTTHKWMYRDVAHYKAMEKMKATDEIQRITRIDTPQTLELVASGLMIPLPYDPGLRPEKRVTGRRIIVVATIRHEKGAKLDQYTALAGEFMPLARRHGAELLGAFETFYSRTIDYREHIWRFAGLDDWHAALRAIEGDAAASARLNAMRAILPHEVVSFQEPLNYSKV